ncbi:hypothetical protein CRI94_07235 [Longibacter salinarum]|uniref:Uncharacterized protein n=1 Tax=Longibacter salinarum TaxID=1850348 RepID=A0A2A8CZM5_9BACT|nr:hypothetical protein [Longibacter salinarum]PEN13848.1 hypothetical protein CRI94_07235 [Longibacter salinarum]
MPQAQLRRPLGVSLISTYDLLMVAILPSALIMLQVFGAIGVGRPETLHVFISVLLSAGIVVSASAIRRGENWARFILLALITIYYVGLAFGAPYTVDLAQYVASDDWNSWLLAGRSVFWIALHGWYFFVSADWFFDPHRTRPDGRSGWL